MIYQYKIQKGLRDMKKAVSAFLTLLLICCMILSALATDQSTKAADVLYALGLFKGTGTNSDSAPIYDLGKTPTRNQVIIIIMLVRLLGKEDEAKAGNLDIPFTDVSDQCVLTLATPMPTI